MYDYQIKNLVFPNDTEGILLKLCIFAVALTLKKILTNGAVGKTTMSIRSYHKNLGGQLMMYEQWIEFSCNPLWC